ncbi:MAG: leucine-rich repeat domain-containing protein [Candidatus Helarchaeota archaeon]
MGSEAGDSLVKKPGKIKRFGRFLSKVGKKALPAVAGIAAGIFVGPAAAPITQFIASKLINYGISINEAALQPAVEQLLTGASSESIQKVLETLLEKEGVLDQRPIEDLLNTQTAQIKELIELAINDSMRPVLDAVKEAAQFIQDSPLDAINELKIMAHDLKNEFGPEFRNYLTNSLTDITEGLDRNFSKLNLKLSELELDFGLKLDALTTQLNNLTRQLTSGTGNSLTKEVALAICSNQVGSEPILSRYDVRYDENLYINRLDAERAISQFISTISTGIRSNIFVLLAGMGIGKTWLLGHIANKLLENGRPVLFFELRNGDLNRITMNIGAPTPLEAYNHLLEIYKAINIPITIILDGLDELIPQEQLNIVRWVLSSESRIGRGKIGFIISCRDYDWRINSELQSLINSYYNSFYKFDPNNGSFYLNILDNYQLKEISEKYQISSDIYNNNKLLEMARYPFITRLFAQYKNKNNGAPLPDPDDINKFMPIFYSPDASKLLDTILGRMGIKSDALGYLGKVLSCCYYKSLELDLDLVEKRNLDKNKYYTLLISSGLFIRHFGLVEKIQIRPLYAPYLLKLAEIYGIKLLTVPTQPEPNQIPISKKDTIPKTVKISNKEFNYYVTLGNKAYNNNDLGLALKQFQLAKQSADKSFDLQLSSQAEDLINKVKAKAAQQLNKIVSQIKTDLETAPLSRINGLIGQGENLASQYDLDPGPLNDLKLQLNQLLETKFKQFEGLISEIKSKLNSKSIDIVNSLIKEANELASLYDFDKTILDKLNQEIELVKRRNDAINKADQLKNEILKLINQADLDLALQKLNKLNELNENFSLNLSDWTEKKNSEIKEYKQLESKYGVNYREAVALQELEKIIGKSIPVVNKIEWGTVGMVLSDNKVLGLGLYECGLTTLPESFGNLINLKELSLKVNQLTTLPKSFGNLINLKELYLYKNQLTTLPESFGSIKSLQTLDLNGNQLMTLPESFGNLKSLEWLSLTHNELWTLPRSILKLTNLQTLDLGGNKLTTLPESFGDLKSLQHLELWDNQLTTLPESFVDLKSLQELWLCNNKLTTLPESFGDLKSLQYLELQHNKLTTLPESFGNLKSLQKLWLYNNQLKTLPELFYTLNNLRYVDIKNNPLSKKTIKSLKKLRSKGVSVKF